MTLYKFNLTLYQKVKILDYFFYNHNLNNLNNYLSKSYNKTFLQRQDINFCMIYVQHSSSAISAHLKGRKNYYYSRHNRKTLNIIMIL